MRRRSSITCVISLFCAACAPDLRFGDDARYLDAGGHDDGDVIPAPDGGDPLPPGGPKVKITYAAEGFFARVDATHPDEWVYLDLDTGTQIAPATPEDDPAWDIAFRRSNIATNGGVTGTGGVVVASLRAPFADVMAPPAGGFEADRADSDDEDTIPDYAFRFWYVYDVETHVLTPDAITYVVATTEGAYVKLALRSYYDGFGTSGSPSFDYRALSSP